MDSSRLILLAIHSLNATLWLLIGVVMVVLGDDGTPMETTAESTGGFLLLGVLFVKFSLFLIWMGELFGRRSTPAE